MKRPPFDFDNLPPKLKIRTVAALAGGVHYSTVRRAWRRGLISGERFNQRVTLFDRDSVLRWLDIPAPQSPTSVRRPRRLRTKQEVAAKALETAC